MKLEFSTCQLTKIDEGGFIGAQIDALGSGGDDDSGASPDQLSHPFGFVSRPRDPENGIGCSLFHYQSGSSERYCWLGDDPRYVKKYPPQKKGGSAFYSAPGSFWSLDGENGTATCYVPYATGKAHLATIGVDGNDDGILEWVHGEGMALTFFKQKAILKNANGSVYIELNNDGAVFNANVKVTGAVEANGAKITATGDVVSSNGVSLSFHTHPTALGPSGPPIPTP